MHRLIRLCQAATIGDFGEVWDQGEGESEGSKTRSEDEEEEVEDAGPDLIEGHARGSEERVGGPDMGQKPSTLHSKPNISFSWALNNDIALINPNKLPHQPKTSELSPLRKQSNLARDVSRSVSPCSSSSTARPGRRRRTRKVRGRLEPRTSNRFGYQIQDVDEFLTRASLDAPGNIPMVLSTPCVLYQTQVGAPQKEVCLPLGMVVNGVLKNRAWLYAQTPHGEEGYVPYACCLPMGILPPPTRPQPCWDTQTDIFPRPSGNRTDTEKIREGTRSECGLRPSTNRRRVGRDSGERSVDGLYLQAAKKPPIRHTLLVIGSDYTSPGRSALTVSKGDVVSLLSSHLKDWFWVRDRNGKEGFIPAVVAGHGFL